MTVSAVLERPRAAIEEWVPEGYDFLLIAAVVALAILVILSERRHGLADAESAEKDVPFALRDLDLTPEAAEDLTQHLKDSSAPPTRPLRGVAVNSDPAPVP